MRYGRFIIFILLSLMFVGCSDPMYGLRSYQKMDLREWEASGQQIVVEKKPETATVLGLFIGLGSFYTEEPILGVIDLLTWPISPLWEVWIAPANANKINYEATKEAWMRKQSNAGTNSQEL